MVNFVLTCQTRRDIFLTKSTITPKFSLKHQKKKFNTPDLSRLCTTITIAASNTWNYLLSGLSIWFKGLRSESFKGGGTGGNWWLFSFIDPSFTSWSDQNTIFPFTIKTFSSKKWWELKKKFQQGTVTDLKLISQSWNEKKCRPDGYRNGYRDLMGKRADENI